MSTLLDTNVIFTGFSDKLARHPQFKQFITYLIIACIGFSVNIISRIIYTEIFKFTFGLSVVLAYLTGMIIGFILIKLFSFDARKSGNTYREIIKFTIVSLAAMCITYFGSESALFIFNWIFIRFPNFHQELNHQISSLGFKFINRELFAHLIGAGFFGFPTNFFGHKLFTFRSLGTWSIIVRIVKSIHHTKS